MDDHELLELAAKASGMHRDNYGYDNLGMRELAVHGVPHCGYAGPIWNPLTDDGDALRLAVNLKIDLSFDDELLCVSANGFCENAWSLDPHESARRAIVRAAAAIGEKLRLRRLIFRPTVEKKGG